MPPLHEHFLGSIVMGALANPTIPPRTTLRSKGNRRKSLPASTPGRKRSVSKVNVQPASTEVISSLISTLSAISSPAEHHFDSLPAIAASHSTPVSPYVRQPDIHFPLVSQHISYKREDLSPDEIGLGVDGTLSLRSSHDKFCLQADLREPTLTGQASSQRTASKGSQNKEIGWHFGQEGREPDRITIGKVSIEPGPRSSSPSTGATSIGMRGYKDLKFNLSNDRLRGGGGRLWIRDENHDVEKDAESSQARLRLSDSPVLSDGSSGTSNQQSPIRIPMRSSSARHSVATIEIDTRPLDASSTPSSIGNGKYVPTRDSSMRHSFSVSPGQRKRRSQRSEQNSPRTDNMSPVDGQSFPERELAQVMDDLVEEDEVTRRIKELKDQKRLRDHELTVATLDWQACSRSPRLSPPPIPKSIGEPQSASASSTRSPLDTAIVIESKPQNSAPSPAVSQRVDRKIGPKIDSIFTRTATNSDGQNAASTKVQNSPPRRSNSRLLRRLSRPVSPITAEKHRRTISSGFSQPQTPLEDRPKSRDVVDEAVQDFLAARRLSQSVTEPQTGRIISFSEVGDPTGSAVFCCVGMGLTRYITAFYDELASTLRLRLITPDRPGVGASETRADGLDTPLAWPDDVRAICQHLNLTKFSILAHSAGAIYALATALRMPQNIRGRLHLLAPWIPPSQMVAFGSQQEALPASALPYSQRFLRSLPATFLKAANSSWLSATSASVTSKSPRRSKRADREIDALDSPQGSCGRSPSPVFAPERATSEATRSVNQEKENDVPGGASARPSLPNRTSSRFKEKDHQPSYDSRLTEAIWDRATTGANPAVDLLVCLERCQPIGFRYVDIKKAIVIHHGSKDTRVPLENVKWLGKTMRKCEVRVLEGEGHGLMASAAVMGNILMEISQEWEDWNRVTRRDGPERRVSAAV